VIIATGSVPIELPFLKFDEKRVLSNVGALKIPQVPRHLVVIGGGVIGLELGSVWRRLGAKVTVVEMAPTILPGNDEDIVKEADRIFRKQGLDIRAGTKVVTARREGDFVFIEIEKDGKKESLIADYVLVSIGRKPSLMGIDTVELGLKTANRGELAVDNQMRTNLANVYAIGDAVGGKLLAHKAEEEGVVAAEVIAGHNARMDYRSMPSVVYTWPEVATVGLAEHEVKASGRAYKNREVSLLGEWSRADHGRVRRIGEGHRGCPDGRVARGTPDRSERFRGDFRGGVSVRVPWVE
jgi:dihydrolipoamide dehydrogenase